MMKFILIPTFILLSCLGCGSKDKAVTTASPAIGPVRDISDMPHKRIKELFVVVFEKNYSPLEWKAIFDQTKSLSENKKQLRMIEGLDDDSSTAIRSRLIPENAKILTDLSQKSLFMMNWSAQDENCKIVSKESWQLICKPRNRENPLNGGLPSGVGALEWVNPNPVQSLSKIPYLKINLKKDLAGVSPLSYGIELRMKVERETESESWFKGDAFPDAGSVFLRADGSPTSEFFPYGYAEMTLGN